VSTDLPSLKPFWLQNFSHADMVRDVIFCAIFWPGQRQLKYVQAAIF